MARTKTDLRRRRVILHAAILNINTAIEAIGELDDENMVTEDENFDLFAVTQELDRCTTSLDRLVQLVNDQVDGGIDRGL